MILTCKNCKPRPFQDWLYGKGRRVFNERAGSSKFGDKPPMCTVCGAEWAAPAVVYAAAPKAKGKKPTGKNPKGKKGRG